MQGIIPCLEGVDQFVHFAVEVFLHHQGVSDGHVEHTAVTDADALVGDAAVEQLHGQMAGFKGEGAVLGGGQSAALGVANNGGAGFAAGHMLDHAGQTLGIDLGMLMNVMAATHEIPQDALVKLRGDCEEEIKRINGTLSLDTAVKWQS